MWIRIIKRYGRWTSSAFQGYLWEANETAKGVAARMARDDTMLHVNRHPTLAPAPRIPVGNPESKVGFSDSPTPAFFWLPAQQALCMLSGVSYSPPGSMGQKKGRGRGHHAPATTSKARAQTPPLPRRLTQLLRHGLDRARISRDAAGWADVGSIVDFLRATRMEVMNVAMEDPDRYEHDPRLDTLRATRKRSYSESPAAAALAVPTRAPSGAAPVPTRAPRSRTPRRVQRPASSRPAHSGEPDRRRNPLAPRSGTPEVKPLVRGDQLDFPGRPRPGRPAPNTPRGPPPRRYAESMSTGGIHASPGALSVCSKSATGGSVRPPPPGVGSRHVIVGRHVLWTELGVSRRSADGMHRIRTLPSDPIFAEYVITCGLAPGDRAVGIATATTPGRAWIPVEGTSTPRLQTLLREGTRMLYEVVDENERSRSGAARAPGDPVVPLGIAESPLSGAYNLPGMGANGVRALLRATSDAAAANARACDATLGAMPEDRDALASRREHHSNAAAALRRQAETLRPTTARAAADAVERAATEGAKHTSASGDARLRQDLKACTSTALTAAVARKAARSRARARQQTGTERLWRRPPQDTDLPRPIVDLTTGATGAFRTPQTVVSCDSIDLRTLPFVTACIHSGRHPSIIQRTIFGTGFQTALHAVRKVLQELMDSYAGDGTHPGTPIFKVNIGSPDGRYRAIAIGFSVKEALKNEGFRVVFRMRGGHDPCRCDQCSARTSVASTSNEARARLARIWGALPKLWPPRVKVTTPVAPGQELDEDPQDLQELYAHQGGRTSPPAGAEAQA